MQIETGWSAADAEIYQPQIVYFGGGTPGVLTEVELARIWNSLSKVFDMSRVEDVTFESTPETLSLNKLKALKSFGFTRVSIGAQSFHDQTLKRIGRHHTREQIFQAADNAMNSGFRHLNVDVIAGLPNESRDEFEASVQAALGLPIDHLSVYTFRLSPDTKFYRDAKRRADQVLTYNLQYQLYARAKEIAENEGYSEYSFYYFSKSGQQSRLCMACFRMEMDWIGFGAGATSLIRGRFQRNSSNVQTYNSQPHSKIQDASLREPQSYNILLANSLTTPLGVNWQNWRDRGFDDRSAFERDDFTRRSLEYALNQGWLEKDAEGFRLKKERFAQSYIELTSAQADWLYGKDMGRQIEI